MVKIFCVCGIGLGTSMMAKMSVDKMCKEVGLKADVEAIDAGSIKGQNADLIVTTKEIAKALGEIKSSKLVIMDNFINKEKMKKELIPVLEQFKLSNKD